jgi:hypothetical protein
MNEDTLTFRQFRRDFGSAWPAAAVVIAMGVALIYAFLLCLLCIESYRHAPLFEEDSQ